MDLTLLSLSIKVFEFEFSLSLSGWCLCTLLYLTIAEKKSFGGWNREEMVC